MVVYVLCLQEHGMLARILNKLKTEIEIELNRSLADKAPCEDQKFREIALTLSSFAKNGHIFCKKANRHLP